MWFLAEDQNAQVVCALNVGKGVAGSRTWNHQKGVWFFLCAVGENKKGKPRKFK